MPANKKKKKATANPARGFATTSVASKQNIQDADDAVSDVNAVSVPQRPESPAVNEQVGFASEGPQKLKESVGLSPEEYEAQLEMGDLQIFLEKHGEKSKREASRQVSKLRTERRVLRAQADPLATTHWLPHEIMQYTLDVVRAETCQLQDHIIPATTPKSLGSPSDDDVLVNVWKLFLTLPQLGFSYEDTRNSLGSVLKFQLVSEPSPFKAPKSGLWGLDECLEWLALNTVADNKLDYETPSRLPARDIPIQHEKDEEPPDYDKTIYAGVSTSANNPEADPPKDTVGIVDTESESGSDLEPEEMVEKYLAYQTCLYKINPNLVTPSTAKQSKLQGSAKDVTTDNASKQVASRLKAKITRIKSDILFDQQEADARWAAIYVQKSQEAAARRRLNISDAVGTKSQESEKSDIESGLNEEDPASMVGDLFGSLPDTFPNPTNKTSNLSTTDDGNQRVQIRDFGKWSGVAPRRVFEEACRARDPSAKVMYHITSRSTFACRHAVTVHWSRPQPDVLTSPLEYVLCKNYHSTRTVLQMDSISCPDTIQSEAFVSTAALFVIFALSPKEEKAHLRLPPIWRDLWVEMLRARQDEDDASDRETLRDLRKLITESRSVGIDGTKPTISKTTASTDKRNEFDTPSFKGGQTSPDSMKAIWCQKSSTSSYKGMLSARKTLPIWQFRHQIIDAIEHHQVIIICGQTGCGKSTQVPAYIMENELLNGRSCKIYCTEPRRISAISLARRVSEELGERKVDVGTNRSLVGFAIRLENQVTAQTRLVYATTGIVMRMLEGSGDLGDITHLLLDEVHERSIDSDFLLVILKKLLIRRPALKVVLMSATVDAQKFSNYLGQAPVFEVPGRTFPVEVMYLEDAIETANFRLSDSGTSKMDVEDGEDEEEDFAKPLSNGSTVDSLAAYKLETRMTLSQMNEYHIPYDLILKLLLSLQTGAFAEYTKAILIFLPGIAEIRRLKDMLGGHQSLARHCEIFALHSTIATEEQESAFLVPPQGMRKVVLATNIAETGITIPDITCVIDTGKHKEMRFDERRQLSRLIEAFISQANAMQRRGRAGRVQRGLCFHLFTKQRFQQMPKEQTPEMLRLSLQDLVLRVKICKLGGIEETLSEALDPPSAKNIQRAIDALQDVKALTTGQDLTPLGRQLARLPLDVFLGKLLLLGIIFQCLDVALTIAAILSSKSPFIAPMESRSQADLARLSFKRGDSDLLTVYNAFVAWRRVCNNRGMSEQQFCRKNFLSIQTLWNIEDLKGQLLTSLVDAGFIILDGNENLTLNKVRYPHDRRHFVEPPIQYSLSSANDLMLNSIIAMSFYPKLLKREGKGWRNVANNQSISVHPTSVNKGLGNPPKWLSFYHIMRSSSKFYNAHETSAVEDMAVVLLCGDAEFKMYAGVIVIDGNRIRFSVKDWKTMLVMKTIRAELRSIIDQQVRYPGKPLSERQQTWMDIWCRLFTREEKGKAG